MAGSYGFTAVDSDLSSHGRPGRNAASHSILRPVRLDADAGYEAAGVTSVPGYAGPSSDRLYINRRLSLFPLNRFGFTEHVPNLYAGSNIGKKFTGKVSSPYLARQCYGFHMRNRGNNLGDQVAVVYLGNGRVEVRNLVSGRAALLDVRDTDGR